jgi:hypothetical protein
MSYRRKHFVCGRGYSLTAAQEAGQHNRYTDYTRNYRERVPQLELHGVPPVFPETPRHGAQVRLSGVLFSGTV